MTANAESERLKLERQIHPRSLSEEQRASLTAGIRAAGWKDAEIIWHGVGEPEIYARDLARAFDEAGAKVFVHTLGAFIPEAWGLSVIETSNGDAKRLQALLDPAAVTSSMVPTNDTLGVKDHPTLFVGTREDVGTPIRGPAQK
jgi:glycine/D-amino acid oxidase-like deaminating enzyme